MNIKKTIIVTGSAILSTFAVSSTAFAEGWTSQTFNSESETKDEQLFTPTSDTTSITFTCIQKKLRVAISTDSSEANTITTRFNEARRKRRRKVDLVIDGKTIPTKKWISSGKSGIFLTSDRASSAKIYNAALKQLPISIQSKSLKKTDLTFPALNKDFSEFGASCGVGILREDK